MLVTHLFPLIGLEITASCSLFSSSSSSPPISLMPSVYIILNGLLVLKTLLQLPEVTQDFVEVLTVWADELTTLVVALGFAFEDFDFEETSAIQFLINSEICLSLALDVMEALRLKKNRVDSLSDNISYPFGNFLMPTMCTGRSQDLTSR